MKYIIEIEEKPLCVFDKDTQTYFPRLWRVKGFNSLVFDGDGLSRLEELNSDYINEHYGELQDEAYQAGMDKAWQLAEDVIYNRGNVLDILNCATVGAAFDKYSAGQALDILKEYESKQKDRIEVGDEVKWNSDVIVITRVYEDGGFNWCDGISQDGRAFHVLAENVRKTGKHYDIDKILEAMKEHDFERRTNNVIED